MDLLGQTHTTSLMGIMLLLIRGRYMEARLTTLPNWTLPNNTKLYADLDGIKKPSCYILNQEVTYSTAQVEHKHKEHYACDFRSMKLKKRHLSARTRALNHSYSHSNQAQRADSSNSCFIVHMGIINKLDAVPSNYKSRKGVWIWLTDCCNHTCIIAVQPEYVLGSLQHK